MYKWILLAAFLAIISQWSINEVNADSGLSENDKLWLQGLREYINQDDDKREFSEDSEDEDTICDDNKECEECINECDENEDCVLSCLYFTKRNADVSAKPADDLEQPISKKWIRIRRPRWLRIPRIPRLPRFPRIPGIPGIGKR